MRVADHRKKRFRLSHAIDDPVRIENLVPAVFRIGLREHHQFSISRIACRTKVKLKQVINFL